MADGQQSMDAILSNSSTESATAEAPPIVQDDPAPKGETSATPAQPAEIDDEESGPPVPRKALISERRKRQELERHAAEMKGRLEAFERYQQQQAQRQQQPQAPTEEEVDPAFFANPAKFVDQKVQAQLRQAEQRQRLALGIELMRNTHQDFQEMEQVFVSQAANNPLLLAQAQQSPNPARFAYEWAKQFKALDGASSVDELKAKWRAEWEAENKPAPTPARTTPSNAGARSVGSTTPNVPPAHQSIEQILANIRKK